MPTVMDSFRLAKTQDQLADLPAANAREGELAFSLMFDDIPYEVMIHRNMVEGTVQIVFKYSNNEEGTKLINAQGVKGHVGKKSGRIMKLDFDKLVDKKSFDTWATQFVKKDEPLRKQLHFKLVSDIILEVANERPSMSTQEVAVAQ